MHLPRYGLVCSLAILGTIECACLPASMPSSGVTSLIAFSTSTAAVTGLPIELLQAPNSTGIAATTSHSSSSSALTTAAAAQRAIATTGPGITLTITSLRGSSTSSASSSSTSALAKSSSKSTTAAAASKSSSASSTATSKGSSASSSATTKSSSASSTATTKSTSASATAAKSSTVSSKSSPTVSTSSTVAPAAGRPKAVTTTSTTALVAARPAIATTTSATTSASVSAKATTSSALHKRSETLAGKYTAAGRELLKRRALQAQEQKQDEELASIAKTLKFSSSKAVPAEVQNLKFSASSVAESSEPLIKDVYFSSTDADVSEPLVDNVAFLLQRRTADSAVATLQFGLNKVPLEQVELLRDLSFSAKGLER